MYLEAEITAATWPTTCAPDETLVMGKCIKTKILEQTPATPPAAPPTNGTTRQRLSTIELTMITGVLISAVSLAINIYNTTKRAAAT